MAQLDLGDGPVLRGPEDGRSWHDWGCYPLLPWSNRIPGGRLRVGGRDHRLPATFDDGSALHGLTADRPWTVEACTAEEVRLTVAVAEGPFDVIGRMVHRIRDGGLDLELTVENRGPEPVPVGLGIHPWFRAGPIRVPASLAWPGDPLPVGPPEPVGGRGDLRTRRHPPVLDRCFTGLEGDTAEVPGAILGWRGPIDHVVVYTGDPAWVAVEPVTMANHGFGLAERGLDGHGVRVLAPGDSLSVGYRFDRPPVDFGAAGDPS